eukprot:7342828-Karenia_brevis.AAC.1
MGMSTTYKKQKSLEQEHYDMKRTRRSRMCIITCAAGKIDATASGDASAAEMSDGQTCAAT